MNKPSINIIVSIGDENVIGMSKKFNALTDKHLKRFKLLTDKKPIIMGRKTQDILQFPMVERVNITLSRFKDLVKDGFVHAKDIEDAINIASSYGTKNIFVMGGQDIFEQFLPFTDNIYITEIYSEFTGDKYFPELNILEWKLTEKIEYNPDDNNNCYYSFLKYSRI